MFVVITSVKNIIPPHKRTCLKSTAVPIEPPSLLYVSHRIPSAVLWKYLFITFVVCTVWNHAHMKILFQVWKNYILCLWQNFIRSLNESTARQTTRRDPLFSPATSWNRRARWLERVCFRQPAVCSPMVSGGGAVIHIVPFDSGVKVEPALVYKSKNDKRFERRWFCGLI